jgi:hypothetical protein
VCRKYPQKGGLDDGWGIPAKETGRKAIFMDAFTKRQRRVLKFASQ